jgi:ribosomal-protein-alanine N-acetyltransferase
MGKELVCSQMISIVPMDCSHVEGVAALEAMCFQDPWSANSVASELNNPLSLWLIAVDADAVIGYVGSQTVMGETDMMNIAVHPDHRRTGVAKALIEALVLSLKERGSHCLTLEVRPSNNNAIALYTFLGFYEVGRRRNYYRNPKEDALILRKEWEV